MCRSWIVVDDEDTKHVSLLHCRTQSLTVKETIKSRLVSRSTKPLTSCVVASKSPNGNLLVPCSRFVNVWALLQERIGCRASRKAAKLNRTSFHNVADDLF